MDPIQQTDTLDQFTRGAARYLEKLKHSGEPMVLTVDGKAEVVVQDVESYSQFRELVERAATILGIKEGLDSLERGEGRPATQVFAEIRARHNLAPG